jgi:glutathione S-transferase
MPHIDAPAVLITMPHSHYAEKARWALDRLAVPYREEPHVPLLHLLATKPRGGRSVPILVQGDRRLVDSTEILRHVDASCGGGRLYPSDPGVGRTVDAFEERFDQELGPHTRRWAYFQLLPHRPLLLPMMAKGVPRTESSVLNLGFPIVVLVIRKALRVTPDGAQRSLLKVRAIFSEISELLADGRTYLVEDRFTAADLTFAALAAPILFPERGISAYPGVAELPAAMREVVEQLRDTRAGRFALRMYAHERWCTEGGAN